MAKFAHLHTHSHYSLLDGLTKVPQLVARVKELGMESVAITDHGVLYGAVEFYKEAKKAGIKAILGVEAYVAPRDRFSKEAGERYYHLILLAENNIGWKNLIQLVTKAHLEGYYYKPRIDKDLLKQYHEGLIALSGCLGGEVSQALLAGNMEEAERIAREYEDIMGKGNYFLEIQKHPHVPDSEKIEPLLIQLSAKTGIPLVATQDSHYARPEDAEYQDVLLAVQTGNNISDKERLSMKETDLSINSPEDMEKKLGHVTGSLTRTIEIAERCNVTLELGVVKLPHFEKPDGKSSNAYLRELVAERLPERFTPEQQTAEVKERMEYELGVIEKTGFADYFLIVQDLINWAKSHGIAVGPGRGSAAGSLISYILRITDLNPLTYGLLFERFLNPERIQMPDIDIDFADLRRDEVLAYAREKYGEDRVAQIITFGTMAARAAIRDAGRAMGFSYTFCDQLAKLVPFAMNIDQTLEKVPEFKELYDTNPDAKKLIDTAHHLEGVARHASVHACGTVIAKDPITEYVPLQFAPQDKERIITQFEMHAIEDLGLLKIDFLGLKNLTIIQETVRLIQERRGETIDVSKISLDDQKTFTLLQAADNTGVFQFESSGMRRYMKDLKPSVFEDLVALVALFRPGPMELIPSFIKRKHGEEPIVYLHPSLAPILGTTYGIGVYQEQMMQIARDLAGYTLPEADTLRKAIGKKIKALLDEQKEKLIKGMTKNGIELKTAKAIWEMFPPFARYGFNKCLTGGTLLEDPITGERIKIEDLHNNRSLLGNTYSLQKNKVIKNTIVDVVQNGVKPVLELTTRTGRRITATGNHPFLTPGGWKNLEELSEGSRIAVPRSIPDPERPASLPHHKLAIVGYLLAEGNLCHPHGFYFYSTNEEEVADYTSHLEKFENTVGTFNRSKSAVSVYSKRKDIKQPSEAVEWIRSIGMYGKNARTKSLPSFVFKLPSNDLAFLIAKMFQGDGCLFLRKNDAEAFYATSSEQLALDFQHALLRLGIVASIYKKQFKYRGMLKPGYTVHLSRHNQLGRFLMLIGSHLIGEKKRMVEEIIARHPIMNGTVARWAARGSQDIIPMPIALPLMRAAVSARKLTIRDAAQTYGFSDRIFHSGESKHGILRETAERIGTALEYKPLIAVSASDVYWDTVVGIASKGNAMTYDLTMEGEHNFIANDIFVHNSHAACYALIGYQTAYLKAHYLEEFMASVMNADAGDIDRISFLINEAKQSNIEVLPPDINQSFVSFTPEGEKIRFGLLAIKNVGSHITEVIIAERVQRGPFKNFTDFLSRIQDKDLNKKSLESLAKAGAFDSLNIERNQIVENIDEITRFTTTLRKGSTNANTNSLFGEVPMTATLTLKPVPQVESAQRLKWEKELLGFYLTDHPLNAHTEKIKKAQAQSISDVRLIKSERIPVRIAGVVTGVKKIFTKKGDPMVFAKIEDFSAAPLEVVVFNSAYVKTQELWEENNVIVVQGRMSLRDGETKLICDQAVKLA